MFDGIYWLSVRDGDPRAADLYDRHYSAVNHKALTRKRHDRRIAGPGQKMILLGADCQALFGWQRCTRPDLAGQSGLCCFIFRNEGRRLSSELILEAEELARQRWPDKRMYTYVDPAKIRSTNPGACFKIAGWRSCGRTQGGLVILEKLPLPEKAVNNAIQAGLVNQATVERKNAWLAKRAKLVVEQEQANYQLSQQLNPDSNLIARVLELDREIKSIDMRLVWV